MRPTNTVIILSDEHNRDIAGCYGDNVARTPNLDRLARDGVRFSNAYTNSPVCVPARASFATGRYPHQIGAWDSATPYDGTVKGWGARLLAAGHEVVSVGKLHFRCTEDDNGFSREIVPMHVHNGVGWVSSLLRAPPAPLATARELATDIGAGETAYTRYDREVTNLACEWITEVAGRTHEKPWVLYVGLVAPHFPLVAPESFFHLYDDDIPPPRQYAEAERPRHPVLDALRAASDYDAGFDVEKVRIARQAYYGLCSFMDDNVGRIVRAICETGQEETTRFIYSSDHGDNIGNRGLWGKSVMYEDSVAIPLIAKGPDLPAGGGRRHTRIADRSTSDDHGVRRPTHAPRRSRSARHGVDGRHPHSGPAATGIQRVSRLVFDHRHVHAAKGRLEAREVSRVCLAIVRSRERPVRSARPGVEPGSPSRRRIDGGGTREDCRCRGAQCPCLCRSSPQDRQLRRARGHS